MLVLQIRTKELFISICAPGEPLPLSSGAVQSLDFSQLTYSAVVPAMPVPPAVWLLGSALGLLGWMKRKTV